MVIGHANFMYFITRLLTIVCVKRKFVQKQWESDWFLHKISLNEGVEDKKKGRFVQKQQISDWILYKISLNEGVEDKKKRRFVQKQQASD